MQTGIYDLDLTAMDDFSSDETNMISCAIAHRLEYYIQNPMSKADLWLMLYNLNLLKTKAEHV